MNQAKYLLKKALDNANLSEFRFTDVLIGGDECQLCVPKGFPNWNKHNVYLRSVIYRKSDYLIVSAGFKKFTNWLEREDIFPIPTQISECQIVTKLDGSLLIISKYNNQFIIRTRGSCSVDRCLNKEEVDLFKIKYPKFFNSISDGYTYLAEWVSPKQKIVLDYGEPDIFLIGIIENVSYSLAKQKELDTLALKTAIKRPETHLFLSFNDLFKYLESKKDFEGFCIYSNEGQTIHKIKSDDYLLKHRFKSNLTFDSMLDYWFSIGKPENLATCLDKISQDYDYECATRAEEYIKNILDIKEKISLKLKEVKSFAASNSNLSRKEFALLTNSVYSNDSTARSYAFSQLTNKPFDDDTLKKYILNAK